MQKKKYIGNIIFMVILLAATFYVLLKDQDLPEILDVLKAVNHHYVVFAFIAATLYLIFESLSLLVILRSLGERSRLLPSLKYSFIGFLFNAITPSASGGQPMQVLYMNADGINMGASSVVLLFWTIIYKVVLVLIEGFVWIFYRDFAIQALGGYQWLFWVGIGVNVVSIFLYGIIVFSKNGARNIVRLVTWLLHKLHVVKRKDKIERKLDHLLESYQEGAVYMRTHLETAGIVLLITFAQRISYFFATWFIYRSFGLTECSLMDILILQSFVSVCIDILPFPGGVGANESFFVTLFLPFIEKKYAVSTMLLSRGVNFYALVVVSAMVTVFAQWNNIRRSQVGLKKGSTGRKRE